jgi:hypothetical protein
VPGVEHKMRQKYKMANGEWRHKEEFSYSAARCQCIHHDAQTMELIEMSLISEIDDRRPVISFTNIELVLQTDVEC